MQTITRIVVHHAGGRMNAPLAHTQDFTWRDIEDAHRVRFDFISSLGRYGGYTFFISKWGEVTQFRAIGEEQAAQKGYNTGTISICIGGNFTKTVEYPTALQIGAFQKLVEILIGGGGNYAKLPNTFIKVPLSNIIPHRALADTDCYGTALDDGWARRLVIQSYQSKLAYLMELLLFLKERLAQLQKKSLGGDTTPCWMLDER